ncbi:inositol 2-dehydrogenase [Paenibacillus sp. LMG 31456]|uniref:Inositol 2-dehydrogenase n=1 Tax=Paenibacillus foliorum TaxID=2654974 RepID=A0A972K0L4_9BACL|nr:inositol 2-dehydrogenase [Paenibacillus foliorum]NOU95754.1 inositol 2-dehydrogenase [Paenibacillus foliorum]
MRKTTIGVIGAGAVGKVHIENIISAIPTAHLKHVADAFPDHYNEWARDLGYPLAEKDHSIMLKDPELEVVIICAPAALHGDLIIEAAKHGKHIFCEKPFDYNIDKIVEAMKEVEKAGVKLQLGFNRRFDKNFAKARNYIDSGEVGDVHIVKLTSRDPIPPAIEYFTAPGGEHCSIYTDTTIHDFDMARFLNNSEVVEVFATGSKLINKDNPIITRADTIAVILRFEDGSMALIDNSWQAVYGYDQRAEVFGTNGTVTVENDVFSQAVLHSAKGIIGEKPLVTIKDRYGDAYATEIREFISAIQNDTTVKITGKDGLYATVIAEAAKLSAAENRIVKISELLPKITY